MTIFYDDFIVSMIVVLFSLAIIAFAWIIRKR